jgi:predicted dehydrogenase
MAIEGRDEAAGAAAGGRPRRIRLGMVGGGQGAFIGAVHRIAARLDDHFELVAGAFSADPARSRASGAALGLPEGRVYGDFAQMAKREARRKDGIEAVAIVTPNHMHAPVARAFLSRGIHVICDKPLTATLREAKALAAAAAEADALFVLTHNYTGYPMVRQARAMVAAGELGAIRVVQVEYAQDWLTTPLEATGQKQADWRTDPARAGAGGATGDIGTHAFHLASFVTGLALESLAADLTAFVPGRRVDDNGHVLLRFRGGAKGMLWCSQVAPGNENALRLRVYGEKGGLEWAQEDPNYLWFTPYGEPKRLITRAGAGAGPEAARMTRVPPGHPEGYLEGFANLYAEAAAAIRARQAGQAPDPAVTYPTVQDGLLGVAFVEACVRSSKKNGAWVKLAL